MVIGTRRRRPRQPRTLRSQLTGVLLGVALISFALVGGLNFVAARQLLDKGTEEQLSSIGQARARSIELGAARLQAQVSALAADLAVTRALEELSDGYVRTGGDPTPDIDGALDAFYQTTVVAPIEEAGLGPVTVQEVRPRSPTGRYLQYHYVVGGDDGGDGRTPRDIADADGGSDYSVAHSAHHPYLAELSGRLGGGDLLLISTAGDIVYSAKKRIDFGTNLNRGPYRDTALAETVRERLPRVATGESVIADWELYLPGGGRPSLFAVATVRRGTEVLGALAVEVPAEALSAITTANQNWEAVGLPSGESYVVGPDMTLISESRLWLEDRDAYLGSADDPKLVALIETLDSPVGIQPVDTEAARAALDGETFAGRSTNYLGQSTFTYATPIDVEGVEWVMIADTPIGEARARLYEYLQRLGLALLILLPIVGVIGYALADRMARPIPVLVEAAQSIASGERHPELATSGNDELSDLGRRLEQTASELGRQERNLEMAFERKRQTLLSVLPARFVDQHGQVGSTGESIEATTAVAVGVTVVGGQAEDETVIQTLTTISRAAESIADEGGLEPVRLATDRYLYLAGVGVAGDGADDGLSFAAEFVPRAQALAEAESLPVSIHVGLATGPVAMGVLDRGSLTFGAWGEPVRRSLAIAALAGSDEILVDESTVAASMTSRFVWDAAEDVISLDGEQMPLVSLRPPSEQSQATSTDSPG